ncbi:hypothetical protein BDC45DRAFT_578421 [Circinella umbellata]|nr:hypothetical protein BDC45DRAFT_578421 [Circinella umbellata]
MNILSIRLSEPGETISLCPIGNLYNGYILIILTGVWGINTFPQALLSSFGLVWWRITQIFRGYLLSMRHKNLDRFYLEIGADNIVNFNSSCVRATLNENAKIKTQLEKLTFRKNYGKTTPIYVKADRGSH